jgi:uncharacterized protein (DUF305 family)
MSTIRIPARLAVAGTALTLSVVLAGCGGDAATTTAPTGGAPSGSAQAGVSQEHNDADIRFAQQMIPHHRQAVEMAEIALDRAEDPEVRALAEQIRSAQDPEIEILTGFLRAWGAEVPADDAGHGMGHGETGSGDMDSGDMSGTEPSGMSGMMTPEQMAQLRSADGAAFDEMFLQGMIAHHDGAVADAQREVAEGVNPQAKELATEIGNTQTAEIARMRQLLQNS